MTFTLFKVVNESSKPSDSIEEIRYDIGTWTKEFSEVFGQKQLQN